MDNETLVGLARFYHVGVVILNPEANWTVVEETPGQAAPHRAHPALAGEHYCPLVPLTDDHDVSAITSAQPQFLAATSAKLDQRQACLQAVERGTRPISAVDAVDQLEFAATAPTTQAARRATAQAAIQRVSAAQNRLALACALVPQPEPVGPPRRSVKKVGTGAKCGRGGTQHGRGRGSKRGRGGGKAGRARSTQSPSPSIDLSAGQDLDAIVAELVKLARAVPSIAAKWRVCLERDLERVEDEETKAAISELLDSTDSPNAALPHSSATA